MSSKSWTDRVPLAALLIDGELHDWSFTTLVRHDGRCPELHNYYPESWQKRDENRRHVVRSNTYSTQRTKHEARNVAWLHARIAHLNSERVYLITHTTSPNWCGIARMVGERFSLMRQRRQSFALLLDRIRKEPGYRGHYWATEQHPGDGENAGTIHHHCAVRFSGFWNYAGLIQRWSKRYCGSSNGLDVRPPVRGSKAFAYFGAAHSYLDKDFIDYTTGEVMPLVLPFRTWGTSRLERTVRIPSHMVNLLPLVVPAGATFKTRQARSDKMEARDHCARATIQKESRRARKAR